ncbi:hypothetical protein [Phenylobacterium sp.]|uniref:hypothetical protein n=1 Tax=Phenylobacterium sp. TaxID=1871053 RepID=UPI002600933D|nr:hypothetical protein [Phenylobacterium sp.]MBX3482060.1 hypothetical protein [Phenylobacterium sp.]
MLDTGFEVRDTAMVLTAAYVLWGGWLVTAAGVVACRRLMRTPGSRRRGAELLAATFAPVAHIALWAAMARFADGGSDMGTAGFAAAAGLHLLMVFAGPMEAMRRAAALPPRAGRPTRLTVRSAGTAAPSAAARRAGLA